ncbi:MAG TPA: G1 family glutamic endopeptidase [Solirubrobacterales bacterium]|nr:G1 family glutamic endopeptidase [Solirubrobacterales bacterium]
MRKYADGGSSYTYQVEEGSPETVTFGKPPQGFDAVKASAEELEDFAFPPRPTEEPALANWEEMVSKFETTAPPIACSGKVGPSLSPAEGEVEYSTLAASRNWSGYIANAPLFPNHFVMAQSNYYQPYGNKHASCKSNALEASWVGVGGRNTGALIQAGTSVNTSNGVGAFAVWTAGSSYHDANPSLNFEPGNYMGMYASYERSTEHVYFYLENATTHELSPFRGEHIGTNYYDGTSAEAIVERPATTVEGELHLYPLLNYGTMTWWNSVVQTSANIVYNIGEVNNLDMEMTRSGNTGVELSELLALPGSLSLNKNWESFYYNCQ